MLPPGREKARGQTPHGAGIVGDGLVPSRPEFVHGAETGHCSCPRWGPTALSRKEHVERDVSSRFGYNGRARCEADAPLACSSSPNCSVARTVIGVETLTARRCRDLV